MFGKRVYQNEEQEAGADRKAMEAALKEHCIPLLRKSGFRGSFPNFHRDVEGFVSLVNFQFYSAGGSFCVTISFADPQRKNVYIDPDTPPNKLKVSQTTDQHRLGAAGDGDRWFCFGKTSDGDVRGGILPASRIAQACKNLLATDAKAWWDQKRAETQF
ncbi:MAG: DUF4304 domain-containing protein [Pseudomonadota bacterium]